MTAHTLRDNPALTRATAEHIVASATVSGDHLVWTGALDRAGQPRVKHAGRNVNARRVVYAARHGVSLAHLDLTQKLPGHWSIMTTCDEPLCVAPQHIRLVTRRTVMLAKSADGGRAHLTHCPRGHALAGDNLEPHHDGKRSCRTCKLARSRVNNERRANRVLTLDQAIAAVLAKHPKLAQAANGPGAIGFAHKGIPH